MKKTLSLLLVVLLVLTINVALAEKTLDKDNLTGETLVTLTIDRADDTFTVIIPSTVSINPETKEGQGKVVLKSGWKLVSGNNLSVKIMANANGGVDSELNLKNSNGDKWTYGAVMYNGNMGSWLVYDVTTHAFKNNTVISVNKGDANSSDTEKAIFFRVNTLPPPGVYTDTLTFEIIIK